MLSALRGASSPLSPDKRSSKTSRTSSARGVRTQAVLRADPPTDAAGGEVKDEKEEEEAGPPTDAVGGEDKGEKEEEEEQEETSDWEWDPAWDPFWKQWEEEHGLDVPASDEGEGQNEKLAAQETDGTQVDPPDTVVASREAKGDRRSTPPGEVVYQQETPKPKRAKAKKVGTQEKERKKGPVEVAAEKDKKVAKDNKKKPDVGKAEEGREAKGKKRSAGFEEYTELLAELPKDAQPNMERARGCHSYRVLVGMTTVEVLLAKRVFFVRKGRALEQNIQVSFGPRSQFSPTTAWQRLLQLLRMPQQL